MEYLGTDKPVNNFEPLLSVCITTYQHAHFIEQCLQSILDQETNFSFEIIIGEDESSDGTREICQKYAELHPEKIRLFLRSRENVRYMAGNPTGRYNFLETLKAARGKYIAFCDGDDYWIDSKKLQKQFEYMESAPEISMSFHRAYTVDNNGNKIAAFPDIKTTTIVSPKVIIEKGGGYCATNSVMFRNQILSNMPDWFVNAYVGDYSLYLLAIVEGKIGALTDIMSCYRIGHTNSWSHFSNKAENICTYLGLFKDMLTSFNESSEFKYNTYVKKRIAMEEIYAMVKLIYAGKLHYLTQISINDKNYILPALKKVINRKFKKLMN